MYFYLLILLLYLHYVFIEICLENVPYTGYGNKGASKACENGDTSEVGGEEQGKNKHS
jgi:hypothetical protein